MERRVITFHYTLTDAGGAVIDTSREREPMSFLEGAGQIISGLEKRLSTMTEGQTDKVEVVADEAYGQRNDEMINQVPRAQFGGNEVSVGEIYQAQGSDGRTHHVQVMEVTEETVTVDGNHPLAGQDLKFDVEIVSIRPATPEEVEHGHVH